MQASTIAAACGYEPIMHCCQANNWNCSRKKNSCSRKEKNAKLSNRVQKSIEMQTHDSPVCGCLEWLMYFVLRSCNMSMFIPLGKKNVILRLWYFSHIFPLHIPIGFVEPYGSHENSLKQNTIQLTSGTRWSPVLLVGRKVFSNGKKWLDFMSGFWVAAKLFFY